MLVILPILFLGLQAASRKSSFKTPLNAVAPTGVNQNAWNDLITEATKSLDDHLRTEPKQHRLSSVIENTFEHLRNPAKNSLSINPDALINLLWVDNTEEERPRPTYVKTFTSMATGLFVAPEETWLHAETVKLCRKAVLLGQVIPPGKFAAWILANDRPLVEVHQWLAALAHGGRLLSWIEKDFAQAKAISTYLMQQAPHPAPLSKQAWETMQVEFDHVIEAEKNAKIMLKIQGLVSCVATFAHYAPYLAWDDKIPQWEPVFGIDGRIVLMNPHQPSRTITSGLMSLLTTMEMPVTSADRLLTTNVMLGLLYPQVISGTIKGQQARNLQVYSMLFEAMKELIPMLLHPMDLPTFSAFYRYDDNASMAGYLPMGISTLVSYAESHLDDFIPHLMATPHNDNPPRRLNLIDHWLIFFPQSLSLHREEIVGVIKRQLPFLQGKRQPQHHVQSYRPLFLDNPALMANLLQYVIGDKHNEHRDLVLSLLQLVSKEAFRLHYFFPAGISAWDKLLAKLVKYDTVTLSQKFPGYNAAIALRDSIKEGKIKGDRQWLGQFVSVSRLEEYIKNPPITTIDTVESTSTVSEESVPQVPSGEARGDMQNFGSYHGGYVGSNSSSSQSTGYPGMQSFGSPTLPPPQGTPQFYSMPQSFMQPAPAPYSPGDPTWPPVYNQQQVQDQQMMPNVGSKRRIEAVEGQETSEEKRRRVEQKSPGNYPTHPATNQ